MASESVENLRSAYDKWMDARQKRYDELCKMKGLKVGCSLRDHDQIVKILDNEQVSTSECIGFRYDN